MSSHAHVMSCTDFFPITVYPITINGFSKPKNDPVI